MKHALLALVVGCGAEVAPVATPPRVESVTPAAPESHDVRIPIKLAAMRTPDAISVRVDRALGTVSVTVDRGLYLGNSYELRVYPEGEAPMASANGYASGVDFDLGEHHAPAVVGKRYIVELALVVFETDVAPDHMWRPEHGARYKVLWTNTLRDLVE